MKFFLNVSRDEEIERLLAREGSRTAWKLNPNVPPELPLWDEVSAAYEDAINRCATPEAPWYLVSADKKWFRNLAVMQRLVLELRPYRALWLQHLKELKQQALKEIRALRAKAESNRRR